MIIRMIQCSERFLWFWLYFGLFSCLLQSWFIILSLQKICDKIMPPVEASWIFHDDIDQSLTLNISDLSASTWSHDGQSSTNSDIRIISAALPLQVDPFLQAQNLPDYNMEDEMQSTRESREQLVNKRNPEMTGNTASFLMSLLKLMDFDANKLGSLSLSILIMIGQTVGVLVVYVFSIHIYIYRFQLIFFYRLQTLL